MGLKMTKRLWLALGLTLLMGIFSLSISQTRAEGLVVDQECSTGANGGNLTISNHPGVAQSFTPQVSAIEQVDVYLVDMVAGSWMGIEILDSNQVPLSSFGHRMTGGTAWEAYTLSPLSVTAGQTYFIRLSTSAAGVQWAWRNANQYSAGSAWYGSQFHPDDDFWFKTYYTSSSAIDDKDGIDDQTATTSTTDTATAMSATTSANIAKPGTLSAKFIDNANQRGVNLEWKTSTSTDITGYLIFRSEKSATGYSKTGQTVKGTLSFLDTNIVASKTYYYQVRAYKDTEQSASSNTASVTTPVDIGPAKPANFKITETGEDFIAVSWDKSSEAKLTGYIITILEDDKEISKSDLAKDAINHKFTGLKKSTSYKIKLLAKDSAGKFSPDAWTFGSTTTSYATPYTFNKWSGLLAGVALALLITLIVTIVRHRKFAKAKN